MNHCKFTLQITAILLCYSTQLFADEHRLAPDCTEPLRPREFIELSQFDDFKDDVKVYRKCIKAFVDEQTQEIEAHKVAAESAIKQWNLFVAHELKK